MWQMAAELRAAFPTLPELVMPDAPLVYSQNDMYIYQMDVDNSDVASTQWYGAPSYCMQGQLHRGFNTARLYTTTSAYANDWCCSTQRGAAVDTGVATEWLEARGIRVAGAFQAQWVE